MTNHRLHRENPSDARSRGYFLITGGRIHASNEFLDWVFGEENRNAGRVRKDALANRPPREPGEQWSAWDNWQHRAFQEALRLTRMRQHYTAQGYDFSFISMPPTPPFPGLGAKLLSTAQAPISSRMAAPSLFNQMP